MHLPRPSKLLPPVLAALLLVGALAAGAGGKMRSERADRYLCETTGGGKFVPIPGFPGEKIDRRLLRDVRFLVRKYKVFITDGYSLDPVHSRNGEHPIGLALDIVPNTAAGGTWRDVGRLARWAEPRQNQPRAPFRWVGYNGDSHHGRGHHLHLSWAHSETPYNKPARTVYSIRCPKGGGGGQTKPPAEPKPTPPEKKKKKGNHKKSSGGLHAGSGTDRSSGAVKARRIKRKVRRQQRSGRSAESGGVGAR